MKRGWSPWALSSTGPVPCCHPHFLQPPSRRPLTARPWRASISASQEATALAFTWFSLGSRLSLEVSHNGQKAQCRRKCHLRVSQATWPVCKFNEQSEFPRVGWEIGWEAGSRKAARGDRTEIPRISCQVAGAWPVEAAPALAGTFARLPEVAASASAMTPEIHSPAEAPLGACEKV